MLDNISVFDCDGHIIESIPEMVPFLDPVDREVALHPSRNRQGVFASLDDMHYPRNVRKSGEVEAPRRPRVDASNHRKGSGEDWVAFLEKSPVVEAVLLRPLPFKDSAQLLSLHERVEEDQRFRMFDSSTAQY